MRPFKVFADLKGLYEVAKQSALGKNGNTCRETNPVSGDFNSDTSANCEDAPAYVKPSVSEDKRPLTTVDRILLT